MERCDIAIIGSGPAGCAAACHAARYRCNLKLFSNEPVGGVLRAANRIDNLPGVSPPRSGIEFAESLEMQLERLNIPIHRFHISRLDRATDGIILYSGMNPLCFARCVILCTGTSPLEFTLPAVPPRFTNLSIHRDIRSLPYDLRDSLIAVIGGGEAAIDSALSACDRGASVTVFVRSEEIKAGDALLQRFRNAGIPCAFQSELLGIAAVDRTYELRIRIRESVQVKSFDYILVCIGRESRWDLHRSLGLLGPPDDVNHTIPGVFSAGDVIASHARYAGIAIGDGIRAAESANGFLSKGGPIL